MDSTATFYSRPSHLGAGFPVFSGSRRQRGGGILGSILRVVAPIAKSVGKKVLKGIAREGLSTAQGVLSDALQGQNIRDSISNRGQASVRRLIRQGAEGAKNLVAASKPLRKRKPSRGGKKSAPKKKKRRRANF